MKRQFSVLKNVNLKKRKLENIKMEYLSCDSLKVDEYF